MVKTIEKSVDLNAIDLNDDLYRISGTSGTDAIAESIRDIGLINFPILEEKAPETYRIICGFKRVIACRRLLVSSIPCRVVHSACGKIECLKLAVTDNKMTAGPGLIEEARALTKLRSLCESDDELLRIARILGMNANMSLVEKYGMLCRLPEHLLQLVEEDVTSMKVAIELFMLDSNTADAIAGLFESLRPTASHQKELISSLRAISALRGTPVAELLAAQPLSGIITKENLDRKARIQLLRSEIRKMRYPHITRFEAFFLQNLKNMGLPKGVSLHAPRDFESPVYTFAVDFKNTDELMNKADLLKELSGRKELTSILKREIEDT
ncbi:MAG: ParB/RepB/Spo0J family partition protein [Desulfosalsimonadaceae bacterium]